MHADDLRAFLDARPFRPFRVCTGSGQEYEVRDTRLLDILEPDPPGSGPAVLHLYGVGADAKRVLERVVSLAHVESVAYVTR